MEAVVVHSGGMDSSVALYKAIDDHGAQNVLSLGFHYGQRHKKELQAASTLCLRHKVQRRVIELPQWSTKSALTDESTQVPEGHYAHPNMSQTVVPNRNSIMLNIAAGVAIDVGAREVITGVHAGDHPVYPDCRPEFIFDLNKLIATANDGYAYPKIRAPFMDMTKRDIALMGEELFAVPWDLTWSCYKGGTYHCGRCSTCVERLEALEGLLDRTVYEDKSYWRSVVE